MSRVFCLMGPTASGKTALAIDLTKRFPLEIISVDSAMIYRGMDIGTAKPNAMELQEAAHHLIDIIDPPDTYSVAQFCQDAKRLIQGIYSRGKIPLLVGGTMMYFKALQQGLSLLPTADETIRARLLLEAQEDGWSSLHAKLHEHDPLAASKINPNDAQRIQRALEVIYLSGKPFSSFLTDVSQDNPYHYTNLLLMPEERPWLHERIATRFYQMLEQGFLNEVETLLNKWQLPLTSSAMRCVGYRQAIDFLSGQSTKDIFSAKAIAATRQLAKRQLTWLRHWPDGHLFACDTADCHKQIIAIIDKILDNGSLFHRP